MCGIAGYIGDSPCEEILLQDLYKLEYRGYDSCGMALLCNKKIETIKAVGDISHLSSQIGGHDARIGIAHTRWATHGKCDICNCHPHLSMNGKWAVVHNGIIENFKEIKNTLLSKGYTFHSETDSEVIANSIQYHDKTTPIQAIIRAVRHMRGSFALAILNADNNKIYAAKRTSPLYVAHDGKCGYVTSDVATFIGKVAKYYRMEDNEFAIIDTQSVTFFNSSGQKITKELYSIGTEMELSSKGEYPYYMLKEIHDIPKALKNTYSHIKYSLDRTQLLKLLKGKKNIVFIGCGTAYHAGLHGAYYFEEIGYHTESFYASEFYYRKPRIDRTSVYILVSQSGETADTFACAKYIREHKGKIIAITNVPYCALNNLADMVVGTTAGKEYAVASTKAYNCQVIAMLTLAVIVKDIPVDYDRYIDRLQFDYDLPDITGYKKIFFIGRLADYITCMEGALKLKEITYINCSSIPAGELKHGTLSLIDDDTLTIAVCTNSDIFDKLRNNISEIRSRGGHVILITTLDDVDCDVDSIIRVARTSNEFDQISIIIPLQLLAYKTCITLGHDPDKPRNLAKSVTVE